MSDALPLFPFCTKQTGRPRDQGEGDAAGALRRGVHAGLGAQREQRGLGLQGPHHQDMEVLGSYRRGRAGEGAIYLFQRVCIVVVAGIGEKSQEESKEKRRKAKATISLILLLFDSSFFSHSLRTLGVLRCVHCVCSMRLHIHNILCYM